MAAVVMNGKALAAKVKQEVKERVSQMEQKPGLAVVLVGDNPASHVYANGKRRDCEECGIYSEEYMVPETISQDEFVSLLEELNQREDIDGILIQLPLPEHLDEKQILLTIRPDKDVDCFHPYNMGRLTEGEEGVHPCTPAGVMRILKEYNINPSGKYCVVIGRSNIVRKPQALMMMQANATVTVCHTKTPDLKADCLRADIIISAAGKPNLVTADMVKEGAVVIDVATTRTEQGGLCGDVDYEAVAQKASYITPVPGGVGPVTRAMLMENTLYAARLHGKK